MSRFKAVMFVICSYSLFFFFFYYNRSTLIRRSIFRLLVELPGTKQILICGFLEKLSVFAKNSTGQHIMRTHPQTHTPVRTHRSALAPSECL